MRTIKFRAWDIQKKEMNQVEYLCMYDQSDEHGNLGEVFIAGKQVSQYYGDGELKQVEVMQYTGLKDRDGKEIYEGDIVEFAELFFSAGKIDTYIDKGIVKYYGEIMGFSISGPIKLNINTNTKYLKVLGNIYENPELLEDT